MPRVPSTCGIGNRGLTSIEYLESRCLFSGVVGALFPLSPVRSSDVDVTSTASSATPVATSTGLTITAAAGKWFSGDVGLVTGVKISVAGHRNLSGTIDWGDGQEQTTASFSRDASGRIHVRGAHLYASGGTYSITIVLQQSQTASQQGLPAINSVVVVSGAPRPAPTSAVAGPVLSPGGTTIHAVAGTTFSGSVGSYVDVLNPTPAATSTIPIVVNIDWGDGTFSAGTLVPQADGSTVVTGSHKWAKPGDYTVTSVVSYHLARTPGRIQPLFELAPIATITSLAIVTPAST